MSATTRQKDKNEQTLENQGEVLYRWEMSSAELIAHLKMGREEKGPWEAKGGCVL